MHTIHIINKVDFDENGPISQVGDDWEEVFLNQGSLDGACGYYSVMMSLIINGIITRNEAIDAIGFLGDGRTNIGKLSNRMRSPDFFFGTYDKDLVDLFDGIFSSQVSVEPFRGTGRGKDTVRNFIFDNLEEEHPVIVGVEGQGWAHWAVAIGMDYAGQDEDKVLYRLLLIDPGGQKMMTVPWNAVLSVSPSAGPYPYDYWGNVKVKITDAVAIKAI